MNEIECTEVNNKHTTKVIDIYVDENGVFYSPWWTPELDKILEELNVPKSDVNRNPWCG